MTPAWPADLLCIETLPKQQSWSRAENAAEGMLVQKAPTLTPTFLQI